MESDWLELEDCFARLVHWSDLRLEALGGAFRAEVTAGIYNYPYPFCRSRPVNAGHEGGGLRAARADADGVGFGRDAKVADVDIVVAGGKVVTGRTAYGDIAIAGSGISTSFETHCGIATPGRVAIKSKKAAGHIEPADCVVAERAADGSVEVAGGVAIERADTERGVLGASGVAVESKVAGGGVERAACITIERLVPARRIRGTGRVTKERLVPDRCIVIAAR